MALPRATKDALFGTSDLVEREVDLPSLGISVRIRALSAAFSNRANSQALETTSVRGEVQARVNVVKLEATKVHQALIDPALASVDEALELEDKWGSAWQVLVEAIDDLSGTSSDAVQDVNTRFQSGGSQETGSDSGVANGNGDGRPDLSVRASA